MKRMVLQDKVYVISCFLLLFPFLIVDIDVSLGLRGAKAFRAAEGKISARTDFCVEIQLVEPFLKSYYFCTDSEDTLNQWVDALNSASAYRVQGILSIFIFF